MTPEEQAARVMAQTDLGDGLHALSHTCRAIAAAIREAVAAERERCAKVAEDVSGFQPVTPDGFRTEVARRIRKGGGT
jgi:hypothetical protein